MSEEPRVPGLADLAREQRSLRSESANLARTLAAIMADPQARSADQRPSSMGRRMAVVTAVSLGPPLTATVEMNGRSIPGVSPQISYRPQVDDLVWLEFQGADPHISPPLSTDFLHRWTNLTLVSPWVTYGSTWNVPLAYWRDPTGWVHLRGSVTGGAMGSTIANLPPGYRPPVSFVGLPCYAFGGAGMIPAGVAISSAGAILYQGASSPVQVALDGVRFRVD